MRAATRLVLSAALAAASALPCACAPPRADDAPAADPARLGGAGAGAPRSEPGREPYFDALALAPGAISLALTGSDPAAPRALALWRRERGGAGAQLLQVTASDPQGRFDFGQWLVPAAGAEWTVAPIDAADPLAAPARSRLRLAGRPVSEVR